ncbi:MAG TPA: hypothetical protein DCF95_03595 [Gammaproteobacteria bacterium]|nr:hypothetical protein [Gammaproteobacteria bacterium]HBO90827.1 hypothetical protein [Acidobacteriota bacterium]
MRSLTADEIATLLNRLGLPSSKFDTEEIAKDLKERTVQNETLSAILTSTEIESIYFDPIWQRCRTR